MRFACHKCHAPYAIADEKVRGKVIKFRCKKCNQVLLLREGGSVESVAPMESSAPPTAVLGRDPALLAAVRAGVVAEEPVWFAGLDGKEQGPLTLLDVEQGLRAGTITPEHFFWRDGLRDWLALEQVPELASLAELARKVDPRGREADREQRRDERQRAAEREREEALRKRRESERQAVERATAEAKRRAADQERATRKRQAELEAERATAELGRVDTGKVSNPVARAGDATVADPGAGSPPAAGEGGKAQVQAKDVDEKDEERRRLVERAFKRRARARVDRHESRVAEEFFNLGDECMDEGSLPLPPVVGDPAELAKRLNKESIDEEYRLLQSDPEAVRKRREAEGEISQVIRLQAGVKSSKKRLGIALAAVGGVVLLVGGFLAWGMYQGWLSTFTGLTFTAEDGEEFDLGALSAPDLSPEEARKLRERLLAIRKSGGRKADGRKGTRSTRDPGADALADVLGAGKAPLSKEQQALAAFYQGEEQSRPDSPVLRPLPGVDLAAAGISLPGAAGLAGGLDDPASAKPEVVPEAPGALGGPKRLTELQIHLVVQRNRPQVKQCLERQLKKDSSVSGKLDLKVLVKPDGKVQQVQVATPRFRGTYLEECLTKRVRKWRFPSFEGEAYELTVPLLLTAQDSF